ncbi:MAG: hypothetical protein OXU20_41600 [Myxococcales bacterium]|nr:hypothetical protein [Myxococcales bacterium]
MLGTDRAAPSPVAMDHKAPGVRLQRVSVTRELTANDHIGGAVRLGIVAAALRPSSWPRGACIEADRWSLKVQIILWVGPDPLACQTFL